MNRELPTISVIVSTYNRPGALRRTLEGLALNRVQPLEVIVGDDGSTEETRRLVDEMREDFPCPLRYVWQEDKGFRLAEIRNKTVAMARGEYIVQIDGDVIPDRNFVADHQRIARRGFFVRGTRVELTPEYTARLEKDSGESLRLPGLMSGHVSGNRIKSLRLGLPGRIYSSHYRRGGTGMGANMAYWRSDFMDINGYDESFKEWGCEDTDLMERLLMNGVGSFKTFHIARCYHMVHREKPIQPETRNARILAEHLEKGITRIENGVDKWTENTAD